MRAVVFDLDNTLFPRERFVRSGLAAVAQYVDAQFGIPAMRAFTTLLKASAEEQGTEFQKLCETFGLRQAIVPELLQVFRTHRPELWLAHGASEMLKQLRSDGWRIAILTNGLPPVQAAKISALGLRHYVDHVIYAAEYADNGKPHRAAFNEVLRRTGLAPEQCVMVGDDVASDIRGGREAGMHTIWMRHGQSSQPAAGSRQSAADSTASCELRAAGNVDSGADAVADSLVDVPAIAASLVSMVRAHAA
jgi:putative hydrolase of the HAD superfamily